MYKISLVITMPLFVLLFSACAPTQGNSTAVKTNERVSELVINNLISNRWCQQNPTTAAIEYTWTLTKDFKATSIAADASEVSFNWSITNDNLLSFYFPKTNNGPIFTKKVSYNYDVAAHKRTMRWTEPQAQQTCNSQGICTISSGEVINFIECE